MISFAPAHPAKVLTRCSIQGAHQLSCLSAWSRFRQASKHVERTQLTKLHRYVNDNVDTSFGSQHHFQRIHSLSDFQSKVPIRSYEELSPWIERAAQGVPEQLTAEAILAFEPTSGSSSARKLIPYTKSFLQEIQAAVDPWLVNLRSAHPALLGASSYWSVSSAKVSKQTRTPGGIPIGLPDDTHYFGPIARWALRKTLAVDPQVSQIASAPAWRRATALSLLKDSGLGLVSVWHPSFFTLLLNYIEQNYDELVDKLPTFRKQALRRINGPLSPKRIWPQLQVISCWTHGPAQGPFRDLRARCPDLSFQGKGLMATEGVVSIPILGACAPVLACTSHFFEFRDLQAPHAKPKLGHELQVGGSYQPILTTQAGLYRYSLGDVVRCMGHWQSAPCLRFEGRKDQRVDLTGEKLNMHFVQQALEKARARVGVQARFLALSAKPGPPAGYLLCADLSEHSASQLAALTQATEAELCQAHHYQVSRRNGQLHAVKGLLVPDAANRYLGYLSRERQSLGDIKPTCLISDSSWIDHHLHG